MHPRSVCNFLKYLQGLPELVCQRRSEVVAFSGVLEAILKRLKLVVYLSSCLVDKSKLVRYCPEARAASNCFSIYTAHFYGFVQIKSAPAARKFFQYSTYI